MNYLSILALFGHLSAILARPEVGYNYAQPQQSLQFNQQQSGSSFQQSSPQFNQIPQQIPNHHLSQSTSQSSLSQFNPQSFPQQVSPQYGVPNFQSSQQAEITPQLSFQQNSFGQQTSQDYSNFASHSNFNQIPQGISQQQFLPGNLPQPQAPRVYKDIYVHVAPEEPAPSPAQILATQGAPRKHYKIIFIKAPSQTAAQQQQILAAAGPVEEKTLIYVLTNKQTQSEAVLQQLAAQSQRSKPEVYFIKYKAKTENQAGQGFNFASGTQGFAQSQGNFGTPILSGESTSSLFSGGLPSNPAPKYGPPGYQKKRSTKKEDEH